VAILATFLWNWRAERRQDLERQAAVAVEVSPLNIVTLQNNGKLPVKVDSIASASKQFGREEASEDKLLEHFKMLKDNVHESPVAREVTLAIGEKITLIVNQDEKPNAIEKRVN
jgi:hypothetical protein